VHGEVDWALRFDHMRMHTSQHILSGVMWRKFASRTSGNQIHRDHSRVDFSPAPFGPDELRDVENEVNAILATGKPVVVYEEDRAVLDRKLTDRALLALVPASVRRLRVVEVVDVDVCPCAGTHVASTKEIGRMEVTHSEGKGADTRRVVYTLK
jgi:misacylated tRNA(Ala) deacylase